MPFINTLTHKIHISENKLEKIIFYILIVDILFVPYLKIFILPYSLPILTIWFIFYANKIRWSSDVKAYIVFIILALFSTITAYFYIPHYVDSYNVWAENFKRVFQFILNLLYFFYIKYYADKHNISIKYLLLMFLLFADALALLYYFDINTYLQIKTFWGVRDSYTAWYESGLSSYFRYNFIWEDPNNPAYAFTAVAAFLMFNEEISAPQRVFTIASVAFLLICAMSSGALLSAIIIATLIVLNYLNKFFTIRKFKLKIKVSTIFSVIFSALIVFAVYQLSKTFLNSEIYLAAITRMQENSGESRFLIWGSILKELSIIKFLFIGQGATLIINGTMRAAHSGHLYLIYAYGMIAYLCFMYVVFRKRKNMTWSSYYFIIPMFIGFTINTMIGEQKFFILQLILMGLASSKSYVRRTKVT